VSRLWIDRRFAFDFPVEIHPMLIERLRGTPARLEERLTGLSHEVPRRRPTEGWSIQEHAGHLIEVEALFDGRLDEFEQGLSELRPADMSNRRTEEKNFRNAYLPDILAGFRRVRGDFVARLEHWPAEHFDRVAHHPRLHRPMRACDMLFFMAEHDDHHLARISELMRVLT